MLQRVNLSNSIMLAVVLHFRVLRLRSFKILNSLIEFSLQMLTQAAQVITGLSQSLHSRDIPSRLYSYVYEVV